ncbi:MAG: transposase [Sulfitobacter sp.]
MLGDAGLMNELKTKLMERMLGAELTAQLGYEDGKDAPPDQANRRNRSSAKKLKGQDGEPPIAVPRDRDDQIHKVYDTPVGAGAARFEIAFDFGSFGLSLRHKPSKTASPQSTNHPQQIFVCYEPGGGTWGIERTPDH